MDGFFLKRLHWIPFMMISVLVTGTLISLIIAIMREHVSIYVPFVSEAGAFPPESSVFTLTLTIGNFLGALIIIIRFLQVIYSSNGNEFLLSLNTKALCIGVLSVLGNAIVGSFPVKVLMSVHLIGAGIYFVLLIIYLFIQTYISYKLNRDKSKKNLVIIRCIFITATTIFFILMAITYPIGHYVWKKSSHDHDRTRKTPDDEGFGILLASSLFEWLMCTSYLSYFATFSVEFRDFQLVAFLKKTNEQLTEISNL